MIVFRADGNTKLGMGHVMRCLSVADAFKTVGEECVFLSADDKPQQAVINHGFQFYSLNTDYRRLDDELEELTIRMGNGTIKAVFVDSYLVTESYLSKLHRYCREIGAVLVYVDDVLSFPYPCDILLNYNIYASPEGYRYLYQEREMPILLLGTEYTPLRKEFQNLPERVTRSDGERILISTGGADSQRIGLAMIRTICEHDEWSDFEFHLIVGLMSRDHEEIDRLTGFRENIKVHRNVERISTLMCACDTAVSAAGSTLYELCATQTPAVTYILADNQMRGAAEFVKEKILRCAGDVRDIGVKKLAEQALNLSIELTRDYRRRCNISRRMRTVVDGNGAERIVRQILPNCILEKMTGGINCG